MEIKNESCLLCGQQSLSLLYDRARGGATVHNYICESCGFVFILPRPDLTWHEEAYKAGEFSALARSSAKPSYQKLRQTEEQAATRFRILQNYIGDKIWQNGKEQPLRALDVGCGTGSFLRFLKGAGWEVVGLEPDGKYTEGVREQFGIDIQAKFMEEYQSDEAFDLVASFHVIEHVDQPDVFLQQCRKLLKQDGRLLLECPAIDRIYGDKVDFFFWDVHVNTFSRKTLSAFLAKNGFEVIQYHWNDNFINILAKKTDNPVTISQYFDNAADIQKRVAAYDKQIGRNLKMKLSPLIKLKNLAKNGMEATVYPIADTVYNALSKRRNYQLLEKRPAGRGLSLTHIAYFGHFNAGDTLLPVMLRDLLDQQIGQNRWNKQPVHRLVTEKDVRGFNRQDGLVIGGGGLFLRDTNPNQLSGWQWSCSLENLAKIKVPITVFAVGYNRFRGQEDFEPVFREHISLLAEKSTFIGLRNNGSIEQMKAYLPATLHHKLRFQPCMTVLGSLLYGDKAERAPDMPPFISLNCAFDRVHLRFGEKMGERMTALARAIRAVSRLIPIYYYAHHKTDEYFLPFLDALEVDYKLVKLYNQPPHIVLDAYRQPLIALGMRGHAQLIPFGCGRPILSIISHNKLQYFLDDINAPEWGVDIHQPNLEEALLSTVSRMLNNITDYEAQVKEKQAELWRITLDNIAEIQRAYEV